MLVKGQTLAIIRKSDTVAKSQWHSYHIVIVKHRSESSLTNPYFILTVVLCASTNPVLGIVNSCINHHNIPLDEDLRVIQVVGVYSIVGDVAKVNHCPIKLKATQSSTVTSEYESSIINYLMLIFPFCSHNHLKICFGAGTRSWWEISSFYVKTN